jgi:1,4-alpha-glucan branching enzyme
MTKKKLIETTTDVPQPPKAKSPRVKKAKVESKQQNNDGILADAVSEETFNTPQAIGPKPVELYSLFTDFDVALFKAGKHYKLYEKFGAHVLTLNNGIKGTYFAVWAPNAKYVSVIGNFNGWQKYSHALNLRWDSSGIWEGFIPYIDHGETYKYYIQANSGEELEKADPFALRSEEPPRTASLVGNTYYEWNDQEWMSTRHERK